MEDFKTLVARFENALVAYLQYEGWLEHQEGCISSSQGKQLDKLKEAVDAKRSELLAYGDL